jgi:hypothetical protein
MWYVLNDDKLQILVGLKKSTYVSVKGWYVSPSISLISRTTHWISMKSDIGGLIEICEINLIFVFISLLWAVQILLQRNMNNFSRYPSIKRVLCQKNVSNKIINWNKLCILHKISYEKITKFWYTEAPLLLRHYVP